METPDSCSSERRVVALAGCADMSRYALNVVTHPNTRAMRPILLAMS